MESLRSGAWVRPLLGDPRAGVLQGLSRGCAAVSLMLLSAPAWPQAAEAQNVAADLEPGLSIVITPREDPFTEADRKLRELQQTLPDITQGNVEGPGLGERLVDSLYEGPSGEPRPPGERALAARFDDNGSGQGGLDNWTWTAPSR